MLSVKQNLSKSFLRFFPILFLLIFFVMPILLWIFLNQNLFSIHSIIHPPFFKQFWVTGLIALITAVSSVVLSYPVALLWWVNKKTKWSVTIVFLVFVPIILGLLTRNYAWISILSYTPFQYSFEAVILVMLYIFIPFAFFILIQGFGNISNNTLEAAKIMGANIFESYGKVIFPQTLRHINIALFFVFANSLCYYITPAMIGGGKYDMIGNIVWKYVDKGLFAEASNISLTFIFYVLTIFTAVLFFIFRRRKNNLSR